MRRTLCSCLLVVLVTAGCVRRIEFGPTGEVTDPAKLLALIDEAEQRVIAVKGEAKLRADAPDAKGVVSAFVAVMHPALLHIETLDFFGKPQAILVADAERFRLFHGPEGKFYQGPATAENLARVLPIVLPPAELTALMLGRAPRLPPESTQLKVDEQARAYVLTLQRGPAVQTLWVDPLTFRVQRSEVRGVRAYDVLFDKFDDVKGALYPRRVKLEAKSASTMVELLYKDVEVNPQPDLTLFELAPPPNVEVIEVDAAGAPVSPGATH